MRNVTCPPKRVGAQATTCMSLSRRVAWRQITPQVQPSIYHHLQKRYTGMVQKTQIRLRSCAADSTRRWDTPSRAVTSIQFQLSSNRGRVSCTRDSSVHSPVQYYRSGSNALITYAEKSKVSDRCHRIVVASFTPGHTVFYLHRHSLSYKKCWTARVCIRRRDRVRTWRPYIDY